VRLRNTVGPLVFSVIPWAHRRLPIFADAPFFSVSAFLFARGRAKSTVLKFFEPPILNIEKQAPQIFEIDFKPAGQLAS
jgi:hypothetical protein